jgi:GNAT superfamily N-acetyltransferase
MTGHADDTTLEVRALSPDDRSDLQRLLEADPAYAERVEGHPPTAEAAHDLLTEAPPGTAPDHKVVLGGFLDGELVAVVDLVRGWPEPGAALIGLLQVHPGCRGLGVGRRVHAAVLEQVRAWPEVAALRAAIVETNAAHAAPFWAALGYAPEGEPRPYTAGDVTTTVTIWTRAVKAGD